MSEQQTTLWVATSQWPAFQDDQRIEIWFDYTPGWTSGKPLCLQETPDTDAEVSINEVQLHDAQGAYLRDLSWDPMTPEQLMLIEQACFDHMIALDQERREEYAEYQENR